MIFTKTDLADAYVIEIERIEDHRGFFARSWCAKEFEEHGLDPKLVQCNISFNTNKGTLRGLHYQHPQWEAKLIRVTRGSIFDVIIDLRPDSLTYKKHFSVNLTEQNRRMLFIPEGMAHGFQTLEDNTEVFYQMSEYYYPEQSRGFRWDDPAFNISWPVGDKIISDRDLNLPNFKL